MINASMQRNDIGPSQKNESSPRAGRVSAGARVLALALLLVAAGCQTPTASSSDESQFSPLPLGDGQAQQVNAAAAKALPSGDRPALTGAGGTNAAPDQQLILREGDTVTISFPGAPNLNATQQIRRDGKISLQLIGEFQAMGLTPAEMEKELLKLYGPYLQVKEVTVAMASSSFPIYVIGSVLRPGKVFSERPITPLDAIMEAGGFDFSKANLKSVRIVRQENGRPFYRTFNLQRVLDGKETETFHLKPFDILYVPERFAWF